MKVYFCPSRREPMVADIPDTHSGALGDYACSSGTLLFRDLYYDNPLLASGAMVAATATLNDAGALVTTWRAHLSFTRIRDGLSNTLLVGEKHVPEPWFGQAALGDGLIYDGQSPPCSFARVAGPGFPLAQAKDLEPSGRYRFGSFHPGICQFVMGDGSVRGVQNSVSTDILFRLVHRADGQPLPDF